jgi:Tfp pilus assembly protein PilO
MRIESDQLRTFGLLLTLTAAWALGLWWPDQQRQASARRRIAEANHRIEAYRDSSAQLAPLSKELLQLRQVVDSSSKQMPQEDQLANLLKQLSTGMNAHQLTDQDVLTQPIQHGKQYSLVPLTLNFKGTFLQIFGFVKQVESLPRMIRITRLELHNRPQKAGDLLTVSLDLCAFFVPGQETDKK